MIRDEDGVTEVDDVSPAEPEARHPQAPRLTPRMLDGVPHVHAVPLVPMRVTPHGSHLIANPSGLYHGILVRDGDATITFCPIPAPSMPFPFANMVVEFTDYDLGKTGEQTVCELHVVYLDRVAKVHDEFSPPLVADGEKWKLRIPADAFKRGYAMPFALKVAPVNKKPILVRAAWVEFPGMRYTE